MVIRTIAAFILAGCLFCTLASEAQTKPKKGPLATLPQPASKRNIYPRGYAMSPYSRPAIIQPAAKQGMLSSFLTPKPQFNVDHYRKLLWNSIGKDSKLRELYPDGPTTDQNRNK